MTGTHHRTSLTAYLALLGSEVPAQREERAGDGSSYGTGSGAVGLAPVPPAHRRARTRVGLPGLGGPRLRPVRAVPAWCALRERYGCPGPLEPRAGNDRHRLCPVAAHRRE